MLVGLTLGLYQAVDLHDTLSLTQLVQLFILRRLTIDLHPMHPVHVLDVAQPLVDQPEVLVREAASGRLRTRSGRTR